MPEHTQPAASNLQVGRQVVNDMLTNSTNMGLTRLIGSDKDPLHTYIKAYNYQIKNP